MLDTSLETRRHFLRLAAGALITGATFPILGCDGPDDEEGKRKEAELATKIALTPTVTPAPIPYIPPIMPDLSYFSIKLNKGAVVDIWDGTFNFGGTIHRRNIPAIPSINSTAWPDSLNSWGILNHSETVQNPLRVMGRRELDPEGNRREKVEGFGYFSPSYNDGKEVWLALVLNDTTPYITRNGVMYYKLRPITIEGMRQTAKIYDLVPRNSDPKSTPIIIGEKSNGVREPIMEVTTHPLLGNY